MRAEVSAKLRSAIRVRAGSSELPVVCLHLHDPTPAAQTFWTAGQAGAVVAVYSQSCHRPTGNSDAKCPRHRGKMPLLTCQEVPPGAQGLPHSSRCCTDTPMAWQPAHCLTAQCSDCHMQQPTRAISACSSCSCRASPPTIYLNPQSTAHLPKAASQAAAQPCMRPLRASTKPSTSPAEAASTAGAASRSCATSRSPYLQDSSSDPSSSAGGDAVPVEARLRHAARWKTEPWCNSNAGQV